MPALTAALATGTPLLLALTPVRTSLDRLEPDAVPAPLRPSTSGAAVRPTTMPGSARWLYERRPSPAISSSPRRACLKLPGIARTFEGLARQARDAHSPHEDYLHEVLSAEHASRHESVIRQRLHEARFPEVKTLDTFDFPAAEGVSATQIHTLARGEWVTAPENLIFAGPIGTGKTHLAIALGVEATKQKRRVLFTRAADLVRQLLEARDTRELTRLQQRLLRVDVLIVDELGFVPFDRTGGELLFNLLTDRYERRATVVTTQSRLRRMGHRLCRRRKAHDRPARSLGPSCHRAHNQRQKLSHAEAADARGAVVIPSRDRDHHATFIFAVHGGARRPRPAHAVSKTLKEGSDVLSSGQNHVE